MGKNITAATKKKRRTNRAKKVGLPAGSLVYFGNKEKEIHIDVITYNEAFCQTKKVSTSEEAIACIDGQHFAWININGLNNIAEIKKIGAYTQLNDLLLEDILDTEHRPKVELLEDSLLVIIKMLYYSKEELVSEHLALLLGKNYLISFQESEGDDVFEPVRKRLQFADSSLRKKKVDYLLFSLLDSIVDNYLVVSDSVSDKIEALEDEIITHPREGMISEIQDLKKKSIVFLQRTIIPAREVVNRIEKTPHHLIEADTKHYFRDLHDHTVQIVDTLSTYRDILWGLTDTYMGAMSNKMNNIMRLLTLISTIFIPLTFIVGVYGMNFDFMPELRWWWAYPAVWVVMLAISVAMIVYFRRKKWL